MSGENNTMKENIKTLLVVSKKVLFCSSSGPGAYAPDAPQPCRLIVLPSSYSSVFRLSHFLQLSPVRLLVRVTREIPSSERWNYVDKNHGR